jgi:hypothetical protein
MREQDKEILFWSPRILCILFTLIITMFALDVFGEGYGFLETLLALLKHQIPTGILVVTLIISWRWEWVGGVVFLVLAVFYIYWSWGRFPLITYIVMCGPMFLMSILFFINWKYRAELKTK